MATAESSDPTYLHPALNPFAPGFFDDPYSQYAAVREADPVHRTPLGSWAVFRYADVQRVLRDPRLSVEDRYATSVTRIDDPVLAPLIERRAERGSRAMLNLDPPDHHRLRRLVAKVFTPRTVEELRPRVAQLVDETLEEVVARGTGAMDVIADLAFPLPFTVISEMLGVPEGRDRLELRDWSGALVKTFDPILTVEEIAAALEAGEQMAAYLQEVIAAKRAAPSDDLLSALIQAEDEGDRLTEQELQDQAVLLFIAGHETTVNLIGNGMLSLLRNRDQLELLRSDPGLDANAVEELLRYDSPVQVSRRVTKEEIEVGGIAIEGGTYVMTCLGAANRDPEQFPDPDRLDLRRENAGTHMSFGGGVHSCLGAHLARLEAQVALGTIARRFPAIELATDTPQWNGRFVLRGLETLPVAIA